MRGFRLQTTVARVLVRLGWAALLALGAFVLISRAPAEGFSRALAWLSAFLVLAWLLAHLHVRRHGGDRMRRDLERELGFDLTAPSRGAHSVAGGRRAPPGFWHRRSHGGERPRFD